MEHSSSSSDAQHSRWDSSSLHSISPMAQQQQMASVLDPCRVPAAVVHGMSRHGADAMDRAMETARSTFERAQQPCTAACRMHSQQHFRTVVRRRNRHSQLAAQHRIRSSKYHSIHSQHRCPIGRADRRWAAVDGGRLLVQTVHGWPLNSSASRVWAALQWSVVSKAQPERSQPCFASHYQPACFHA